MKKLSTEFIVGLFLLSGVGALLYLSVVISGVSGFGHDGYRLLAKFQNSSGLKKGAFVEIAGVRVGHVDSINLDKVTQESAVWIKIDEGVKVQEDASAAIRTSGIIGDKFIKISTSGSSVLLADGEEIIETEPAISIEELISKYIFSN